VYLSTTLDLEGLYGNAIKAAGDEVARRRSTERLKKGPA